MCFFVHPKHPDVKIAGKDIVCYKEGLKRKSTADQFRSFFKDYTYYLGQTYVISEKWPKILSSRVFGSNYDTVEKGFHSYSNKKRLSKARVMVRVRCIIPKEAKYLYDPDNQEYVSDQIIVQEFMK